MVNIDSNSCFEERSRLTESMGEFPAADQDLVMERILKNIHSTPIGQVLNKIASLPEVRKEKILDVRQQLTEGKYDLSERLDVALEKVLEDIGP